MKSLYKDFFFHFDISVLFSVFILDVVYVMWQGINLFVVFTFLFGMLFFSLSEYLTHRFLFHIKTPKNPFLLNLIKRLHFDHHVDPKNLHLLFLPIWYSFPNFVLLCVIFYISTSMLALTVAFGGGLICMLLLYEWKHYIAHTSIKPRTQFGQRIKKLHLLHHYKNENYWFGVSSPYVDIIFGTLKQEKDVELSPTAKDLEKRD